LHESLSKYRKERRKWEFGNRNIVLSLDQRKVLLEILVELRDYKVVDLHGISLIKLTRKYPDFFYRKLKTFLFGKHKCSPVAVSYPMNDDTWLNNDISEKGRRDGSEIYVLEEALNSLRASLT
jgi:hypothetical protein